MESLSDALTAARGHDVYQVLAGARGWLSYSRREQDNLGAFVFAFLRLETLRSLRRNVHQTASTGLTAPTSTPPGRYRPTDSHLAFLETL